MKRRRSLITALVAATILAVLVSFQFNAWKRFDWTVFWLETRRANFGYVAAAIALIYASYWVRAARWSLLLSSMRPTTAGRLLPPTLIGFTGLAMMGRAGELVRPYLIARREGVTVTSQLAIWTVERLFDAGAFAVLLTVNLLIASNLPFAASFRRAGLMLMLAVAAIAVGAFLGFRHRARLTRWLPGQLLNPGAGMGRTVAGKIEVFTRGLYTIREPAALLKVFAASLLVWMLIASAVTAVMHAYPPPLRDLPFSRGVLLIAFSMVGSFLNVPTVGGGTQLAVIAALTGVLGIPPELAASSGIMFWLVGHMAVAPVGLFLAHRERVSLRRIARDPRPDDSRKAAVFDDPPLLESLGCDK
jgi:hypothetical protein